MTSLTSLAESHGRHLVAWLTRMNAWALMLFVGALTVDRLLARRVRASWRIALYAPLVLRILLPGSWTVSVAHAPQVMTLLTPVPVDLPPAPEMRSAEPSLGWPAFALASYVGICLLLSYAIARRHRHARRVLLASRPVPDKAARVPGPCPLVEHAEEGPMVVGLLTPHIVLPTHLLSGGDTFTLASVLRHESAHIERRDPLLAIAMQVFLVVFWPVLPLWAAAWRVRQLMEIACDESALASASPDERRHYGHALLDLAELESVGWTPMAGQLHFGSTLRARIEALACTRRWPLALQVGLVGVAAAGFGACSSMAPAAQGGEAATARAGSSTGTWAPPGHDEPIWALPTQNHGAPRDVLETYCGPFFERVVERGDGVRSHKLLADWTSVSTEGLPAEQVAFCRSEKVLSVVRMHVWSSEARNALGQIGKDTAAAFEKRRDHGNPTLCPSAPPIPREMQAPNAAHEQTKPTEWRDGAGFECLNFSFSVPTYFQYRMDNDPTHLVATARSQGTMDGHLFDVSIVLRGDVVDGELRIAPYLEETWKAID